MRGAPSWTAGAASCGADTPSSASSALPFAEEHGGIGGGPVETMIVMEAFGRALALEPYLRDRRARRRLACASARPRSRARRCCRRSRPASCCSRSPIPSGSRAMTSPTSRRPRARTAPAMCSTARRASSCTATAPTSSSCRRALAGEQRDQHGIGLFLVDAKARRRVAPRLSDRGRAARRRGHARRRPRRRRRGDRRARQCVSADRARGRRRHRGARRRSGRRDGGDARADRRLPQDSASSSACRSATSRCCSTAPARC